LLHEYYSACDYRRILNLKLERKIMSAETAAGLIRSGDQIGMSGLKLVSLGHISKAFSLLTDFSVGSSIHAFY